ncbi:MAG: RNA polymerase sigma factor [Acidimicrobiia bacterium]
MATGSGHSGTSETQWMGMHRDARFEGIYRAHAADVLGYCARRTSREEAKDAASEVFVVALRRIDDMPAGDEALPWLYGVARNVLKNRDRSGRRRLRLSAKLTTTSERSVPGPEPQVVRNSEHEELLAAVAKLPERDREVLRLVEWEGLSREQVADMFFVSRAAIDQRISRSYKKLARTLGVPQSDPRTAPVPAEEGGEV